MAFSDTKALHHGTHVPVMSRLWDHYKGPVSGIIRAVIDRVQQTPSDDQLDITFFCTSGRHRSVALSLFCECALKEGGHTVDLVDLCRGTWKWVDRRLSGVLPRVNGTLTSPPLPPERPIPPSPV